MVRTLVLCFGRTPSFAQALWFHEGFLAKRTVVHSLTYHLPCITIILVWHSKFSCDIQTCAVLKQKVLTALSLMWMKTSWQQSIIHRCTPADYDFLTVYEQAYPWSNYVGRRTQHVWSPVDTDLKQLHFKVLCCLLLTINPLLSFYPMIIAVEKWSVPKYNAAS